MVANNNTGGNNGTNSAPVISGSPPNFVSVGQSYDFTPTASDADGDSLTFAIANRPSWASFTASTGRLFGTPTSADVGTFNNIQISVTDGQATSHGIGSSASPGGTPGFSITVQSSGSNGNSAPVISGSPPTSVTQDTAYSFQPSASDADGDQLTFSISKPTQLE